MSEKVKVTMEQAQEIDKISDVDYEVELKPFKTGDWITHKLTGEVGKITRVVDNCVHTDVAMGGYAGDFRYSTNEGIAAEKERRWWSEHGRDVWELKKGDIVRHKNSNVVLRNVTKIEGEDVWLSDFPDPNDLEWVENNFIVVNFAENRLDVSK
jgi:hypothetical protein